MKKNGIKLAVLALWVMMLITACGTSNNNSITKIDIEKKENLDNISIERTISDNVFLEGENVGGLKESQLLSKLEDYSVKLDISPIEARLDSETWKVAQKERIGKKVNVQKTLDLLMNAKPGDKTKLAVERLLPKTKAKVLSKNIVVIGKYSSRIVDRRDARLNNIRLAAERMDFEKLQPGEQFSFNYTLGKRTVKKGYEKAPIIIKTEKGPKKAYGIGGGICQLSSTLFNAAYRADMKITERHSHSKVVGYVPKGWDAMVAYGSSDFKFVNNRSHPVMIRVYITRNYIKVKIYENRNS